MIQITGANGSSVFFSAPYNLQDQVWHMLDVTYDGTSATVYLDGQLIGSAALTVNTVVPGSGLQVGGGGGGNTIDSDEAAIYPTALSPDRIAAHWTRAASKANALCAPVPTSAYAQAVLADRPSAYYRLGDLVTDASDRVAFDSSGQCHNGAYAPRVTAQPSGALVGDVDGAITGPAFTAPAVIQSGARLPAGNSARTFEIWYRSQWGVGLLMSSGDFCLCLRGTTGAPLIQITGANGSSVFFSAPFNLQDQVWHMLDVTYDGTSATVYLDGQLIGSAALTVNTVVPGSGLQVGGGGGGNTIDSDEAAIYPTALSPDRIAAHFKRTASGPPPPIGTLSVAESSGAGNASERWCACAQTRVGGSPINAATGNFYHSFSDIAIPGRGIPLAFSRTYNSTSASTDGPLGFGWTSSYGNGMSLIQKTGAVTVVQENGAEVTFTLSAGTYSAPPRVTATLVKNADATFTFIRNARDRFTFSATGQLTQEQDLNGYSTTFVRNATRELVTVTDPAKRRLSLAWTGTHVSSVTDQTGRSVLFAYNDGQGNLTDVTDVNGGITRFTYGPTHLLLTITDPRGGVVSTDYDASNRVDWQTDQLNRKTSLAYTGDNMSTTGGTTTITDPKGNVSVEQYQYGERMSVTKGAGTPQAATWKYTYDPATLGITTITDPNKNVTTMTYDAKGNRLTSTDALNRQTVNTYNSLSEVLTTKDPNGVTTTMTYDAQGNIQTTSTPLVGSSESHVTTYQYTDAKHPGDVTGFVDPNNGTWKYGYDIYGDQTSQTDPLGQKTSSTFNTIGWKLATVNPKGRRATYGYTDAVSGLNKFGDVVTVTDPADLQSALRHPLPSDGSRQSGAGYRLHA